jgi:hypothetical protein
MKRRLFTIASVLSLVLCVATVAAWVRSYWYQSGVGLRVPVLCQSLAVLANDGKLIVVSHTYPQNMRPRIPLLFSFGYPADRQATRAQHWIESG